MGSALIRMTVPAAVRMWLLCLSVALIALPHPAAADDGESFFDGLAALDGGDVVETVRIWSGLAEAGDVQAKVGLAGLYLAGNGVAVNPEEAARLYRSAALEGDSNGQLNLGRLYLTGVGVEEDRVAAYAWLSLAAKQGRRWADEKRLEIEPLLSAAERTEAEILIKDSGATATK